MAPVDAPEWTSERETLWNAVERKEDESTRRGSAPVARENEIAPPREFSQDENRELVRRFVEDELVSRGMVADFAIHQRASGPPPFLKTSQA